MPASLTACCRDCVASYLTCHSAFDEALFDFFCRAEVAASGIPYQQSLECPQNRMKLPRQSFVTAKGPELLSTTVQEAVGAQDLS